MPSPDHEVVADEAGIWLVGTSGHKYGCAWDEICAVTGHKVDGITDVFVYVVLDFEFGEFIEILSEYEGFEEMLAAITTRLRGIEPGWFARIAALDTSDAPIEIWRRD